ncbi:hypothetical protein MJT46_019127 [Ovis ammon polii x Ovis aries]|nr:hypothetical protein MJT46_019127 [Ovis ammon polii x Ovis aries]
MYLGQLIPALPQDTKLSGQWRTVYIGSTDPEKIQEDGPFRTYFHKIVFDDEKGTVDFYFYVKQNGKWKNVHVTGTKQDDGTYSVEYEGQNEFKVLSVSKTHLVAHNFNVDKQGKETELTGLFVKFNVEDEDEDLEKFRTEDQGSDRKYVVTFAENGEWKTHYIAASNKDKITENGPFHIYVRHVEFHANDTVDVDFYVKSNGECVKKQVTGEKEKISVYHITYAGENQVIILHLSADTIIGSIHNVDEEGKETELVGILGKRDQISDIDYEKFKKEASDRGIPEENIVNFIDNGEWRTHYIASSNIEKITENGPFHIYARYIQFNADNTVDVDFYIKSNGECIKKHETAQKQQNFTYTAECKYGYFADAGHNEGRVLHVSHNSVIGHLINVDEEGNETDFIGIIGTDDEISDSDFERFKEETRDKGIPEENIINFIDNERLQQLYELMALESILSFHISIIHFLKTILEHPNSPKAGQNEVQIPHVSENSITGHVKNVDEEGKETDLVGIIADNVEKITEDAPFHIFMRYIEFDEENGKVHFHFYIKKNGQCIEKYVSGLKEETHYAIDYAGRNEFQLISGDKHYLIVRDLNVDADGKETELVGLLGAGGNVDPKHEEEFRNAVREKGIPEENIRNFIDHDNCPEERKLVTVIVSDNVEKITEGAPFHIFMRYIEFDEENGTVHFRFYIKKNGECIEKYVSGLKEETHYAIDYAGHNEFQPISGDKDYLLVRHVNVDGDGKETELVGLFGAGDNVDPKHEEEFRNAVRERGIPEENIRNFINSADNIEKITEGAPFHIFMHYIEFDEENNTILYHFYVKEHGECIEKYVSGTKEENFYAVDYAGHNEFRPVRVDNGALIAHVINVDEHGKETELVISGGADSIPYSGCKACIFMLTKLRILEGRGDDVGPECKEEFYNTVKEKGIPEENILNFIDNDEGENVFDVLYASDNVLVAHNTNVDEHGKKTVLTGLCVKPNIEEEGLQKFQELMEEKGIDEKNIVNFIESGNGIILFPKCVIHPIGKGDSLTQEDIHKHEELNSERGIPNENIDDATKTGSSSSARIVKGTPNSADLREGLGSITANWYTIYMAADHKEKIEEGGPLRTYFRQFECIDNCEKMSITFILTNYNSCTLITVVAQRAEENVYHVDYMGKNSVQLIPASESMLVFYAENFDGEKTTKVTYALGKGDSLSQEDIQKYEEINNERGIPNENTEDGSNTAKGDGTTEEETQQYEELNKERGIPSEHVKDLTQTVKGDSFTQEELQKYQELNSERGTPNGNIEYAIETGKAPEDSRQLSSIRKENISWVTGQWHTIYAAAHNKEKIMKGGPLRCYYHQIECINDCKYPSLTFYAKDDGRCQLFTEVIKRQEGDVYVIECRGDSFAQEELQKYQELNSKRGIPNENIENVIETGKTISCRVIQQDTGINVLQLIHVPDNMLVTNFENDDGQKITKVTEVAEGDSFTQEKLQKYLELNNERGIPNENIENVIETGKAPEDNRQLSSTRTERISWIPGEWRTIYAAADNKDKIVEGGPLRNYYRRIECIDDCESLSITFYLKQLSSIRTVKSGWVTGEWRTIYSAADNKEKIVEGGPLRCYNRKIECTDDCEHLSISFYVKSDGRCQFFSGVLKRQEGGVYFIEFEGANYLQIIHVSDNILVLYFENDDGQKITKLTEGCAKGTSFTQEEFQKYQQLNTERGIPNENIEHVIKTDDCPP